MQWLLFSYHKRILFLLQYVNVPMKKVGRKKYCLALVAMAASWSSRRSGESEFCGRVMNLASTGTEMDFLSQPVNQRQGTNIVQIFWNGLDPLLMYEKCIKNYRLGPCPPSLPLQASTLKKILMKQVHAADRKSLCQTQTRNHEAPL